ncbi:MAG: hypothetical protein O3C67_08070 [Cyanobacteria bacterium]|nr:hypothetical protein [Cyanobacteriota bacterium]
MSTRKVTIKSLDLLSVGKIQGIILAFFALIFAVFFALIILSVGVASEEFGFGIGGAIGIIIVAPILYGISGFIAGIIGALLYNLAAGVVGGIQFEFKYDEGQL